MDCQERYCYIKISCFPLYSYSENLANNLANASLNAWINEVKNEISSITDLATTTAFTSVENKIPNFSDLVKKTDYDAEITDIKNKYSPYLIIISSWLKYLMQR